MRCRSVTCHKLTKPIYPKHVAHKGKRGFTQAILQASGVVAVLIAIASPTSAQTLYASTYDGHIYKVSANGSSQLFATTSLQPWAMTTDRAGNLYVVSSEDGTVHQFSHSGRDRILATLSLDYHDGIAVDRAGNVYVSSVFDRNIVRITPDGTTSDFVTGLTHPGGLAIDSTDALYVAENTLSEIDKFSAGTTTVIQTSYNPVLVAVTGNGNVVYSHFLPHSGVQSLQNGTETALTSNYLQWGIAAGAHDDVYYASGPDINLLSNGTDTTFATLSDAPLALAYAADTPEPSSMAMLASGVFAGFTALRRFKQRHQRASKHADN